MPAPSIHRATVFEDSGASCMARIVGNDAANATQASITGITYSVYNGDTAIIEDSALTVATVVFDTLQTDARWTEDSTGYNFRHDLPATTFPTGDAVYRVEYVFNPVSGEDFAVVFELTALNVMGS